MPRIKLVNSLHDLDFASRQLIHPAPAPPKGGRRGVGVDFEGIIVPPPTPLFKGG